MLFQKAEEYRCYNAEEGDYVVPLDGLALEYECADDGENHKGNAFLKNFQLHQVEGAASKVGTDPVGRNHKTIFEESYSPRDNDNQNQRPAVIDMKLGKLELPVPGKRHEDVGYYQQQDSPESLHFHFKRNQSPSRAR